MTADYYARHAMDRAFIGVKFVDMCEQLGIHLVCLVECVTRVPET